MSNVPDIINTDKLAQNFIGLILLNPNDKFTYMKEFVLIMDNFLAEINHQFKFRKASKVNEMVDIINEVKNRFQQFAKKVNNSKVFPEYIHDEVFFNALKKRMPKIYEIYMQYKPIIIKQ